MATINDILQSINAWCEDNRIAPMQDYPLIARAKQYLESRGNLWERGYRTPHEAELSDIIELFKAELTQWNGRDKPSKQLTLLPSLINQILPTCKHATGFKFLELDLNDIYFLEVAHQFSDVWRSTYGFKNRAEFLQGASSRTTMAKTMTSYFFNKYAPAHASELQTWVQAWLLRQRDLPFALSASLLVLAQNNLLQAENVKLIQTVATYETHELDLDAVAKSLVMLNQNRILSNDTRGLISEYMRYGVTNEDWGETLVHDASPIGLASFYQLFVNLDRWSLQNARVFLTNINQINQIMEIVALDFDKPLSKLLHQLNERGLLTNAVFEHIIGHRWVLYNLAACSQQCLENIPSHAWTEQLLERLLMLCSQEERAAVGRDDILNLIPQPALNGLLAAHREAGNSQSTHSASVHATIAASLRRLAQRYQLTREQINHHLDEMAQFANSLSSGDYNHLNDEQLIDQKTRFAADSIQRLLTMARQGGVVEAQTEFDLSLILALVWAGVEDNALYNQSFGLSVKDKLVNELHNIEVAYGITQDNRGAHSCDGGTINGLLLPLDRVHPDVTIALLDKAAVTEQTLNVAKSLFLNQFKLKLAQIGDIDNALIQYNQEIEQVEWQDASWMQWYADCMFDTKESIIAQIDQQIDDSRMDNPEQIMQLKDKAHVWIDIAMNTLNADKYMLEPTKVAYEKEKTRRPNASLHTQQSEVGQSVAEGVQPENTEQTQRNQTAREARLKFFRNRQHDEGFSPSDEFKDNNPGGRKS